MNARHLILATCLAGLACGLDAAAQTAERLADDAVAASESKGVVLLAVRWDRRWKCAGYENAQLRVLGFDKLPSAKPDDDASPDLLLDDAPLLLTRPAFDNYAFLVEPGEYGLSRLEIKVARSMTDVGFFKAPRSKLLPGGQPLGGKFTVAAGEVVYLGHFYLDCYQQPILWRYYPEGREGFKEYLVSVKRIYPALDVEKVTFRLFQTQEFGRDYKLP